MTKENEKYIPALTGVRAVAAILVFLHHNPLNENTFGTFLHKLSSELHFGVTLFFVLSGFLITHRYFDKKLEFKTYFINRFARIYPMFFILTLFTFAFYAFTKGKYGLPEMKEFFANISFMKGFFDEIKFTGIVQSWTLTVEEFFYISAPLFFLLIKKWRHSIFTIPIMLILLGLLLVKAFEDISFLGLMGSNSFMLLYTFFGRSIEFFVGIGLALLLRNEKFKPNFRVTYIGLGFIILCAVSFALLKDDNNEYGLKTHTGILINNILLPMGGISLFYYGLIKENTFLKRVLSTKLMVLLGQSSYVFYLIHMGVINQILSGFIPSIFIIFIILMIISITLFKLLEDPLNKFIRAYFTK